MGPCSTHLMSHAQNTWLVLQGQVYYHFGIILSVSNDFGGRPSERGGGATKNHHGIPIKKDQNFRYLCRWRPLCTSRIVRTTIGALSPVNIFSSWQSKRPAQRSRPTCIVKEISNLYLIRGKKEIGRRHLFQSSRQMLLRRDDF